MRILVYVCLAACSLFGQPGRIERPSMGFVFDQSSHALRRIQGIPGAALVAAPVDFGFAVSAAYVAPRLDSVFVLAGDGAAHLFQLTADAPLERALDSLGAPLRVVFSPSGSAAALYSPGSVQVIKGLPDAPVAGATLRLSTSRSSTSRLSTEQLGANRSGANRSDANPPRRAFTELLAISDDGAYLLYAAGGPIELIGVAGDNRQVMDGAAGALAAFAPGGHDAAIIHGGKLILFQDIAGAATQRSFDGVAAPSAVAFSPDGSKLFVASATGRAVTTIQPATGDRSVLACNCSPTLLVRMGPVFRLTELGAEPLWLLDTASERGLLFVPAPTGN